MPDPTKPRVKATRKKTNGVYDTDSPSKAAESGQSPTASRDANSTGAAGSNSAEQLWDETADLVRICGKLVDKKRSAAIRSAVEKWSQAPKHERQSITALARKIGVSRQYIHRVLRKSAPLEDAASRVSEARNPEPDQPRDLQEPEDDVNRSVNCALVDTEPQNRQESIARAIGRNETVIEAGRLTRFQVGASANPGGRPRLKPLSTAYRRMLDKIVPGTNQTYADLVAEGMVRSAAKGRSDAARELCDRVEGKIPRPVEAEGAYSLIIDASEVPAAFKPVRLPEELPAAVDGDQREPEEQSEQGDASDYQAARQQLNRRLNEVANCTFVGVKLERILVEELAEDFLRDYRVNEKKSLTDAVGRWKHLRPFFGHMRAMNVSTQLINSYVDARLQEGAQNDNNQSRTGGAEKGLQSRVP